MVGGNQVGYLPRDQAKGIAAQMDREGVRAALCGAKIVGGWRTNQHDAGHFGIFLAIPNWGWIDFGIGATPLPPGEGERDLPKRPTPVRPKAAPDGPLAGHSVAIMGATTDGDLAQELAAAGAKIMAGVGKSTTLLVVVDERPFSPGVCRSASYVKAEELITAGHPLRIVSLAEVRALMA